MAYPCKDCEKEFDTAERLAFHEKTEHGIIKKTHVQKRHFVYLVMIVFVLGMSFWTYTNANQPGRYDDFAKCITEEGAKLYGTFWCPMCAEQKKAFGKSINFVNYIECSLPNKKEGQTAICKNAGISSYPTWEFPDGSRKVGAVPFAELSKRTGCVLP